MDQDEHKDLIARIEELEDLVNDLSNWIRQKNYLIGKPSLSENEAVGHASNRDMNSPSLTAPSPSSHLITFDTDPFPRTSGPLITFDDEKEGDETGLDNPGQVIERSELWLNRIGVTLLLLGLGFLFKYSIDREWITPLIRVVFGMMLGTGLIAAGLHVQISHRVLSRFLMGSGVAAFYISGFAAFQLYHLVSHYLALSFMTGTSLLAYYLAMRQNVAVLSLVSVIGGLGTPFLLHTGSGNIPGLVLYTCGIVFCAMGIFYFRPWRSLLWSSWIGGWIVLGIAINTVYPSHPEKLYYSWSAQAGLLFFWFLYWVVPLIQKGADWKPSIERVNDSLPTTVFDKLTDDRNLTVTFATLLTPLVAFIYSKSIWILKDVQWGGFLIAAASVFFLAAMILRFLKLPRELTVLHVSAGTIFLTLAFYYLLEGNWLLLAYAGEAALLNFIGFKTRQPAVSSAASLMFAGLGLWVAVRMFQGATGEPVLNFKAAADLAAIGLAGYSSLRTENSGVSKAYALGSYLVFLALILRELTPMTNGNGMVSIAWGMTGSIVLWAGLRRNYRDLFKTGFATLILVAGKLIIIDLAHLEMIWRIMIFMGFGGAFLLISYWMKDQWKQDQPEPANSSFDPSFSSPYARKIPPGA